MIGYSNYASAKESHHHCQEVKLVDTLHKLWLQGLDRLYRRL